ncbi:hypothetical protein JAAARDRAFT_188450 [Jaapia argillacea MUCL 33604]|uniref:Protein kinase domain-containing protein n=1 Tax=Jaapia argillacea MUCL 33604 TaxID=933084 RepID=A0A067QG75_9AGAM|nr:hypothetical protein JAAARDRAFT_188450 [Jaapia argillacea MUCL 33604]
MLAAIHKMGFIHADLKPDNILYEQSDSRKLAQIDRSGKRMTVPILTGVAVHIVDFGRAVSIHGRYRHAAVATVYRAPEVDLVDWGAEVDIFALGCVFAEMFLGKMLFPNTHSLIHRMYLLEGVIGNFPLAMARLIKVNRPGSFLSLNTSAPWMVPLNVSTLILKHQKPLETLIPLATAANLIRRMSNSSPEHRIRADEVEHHYYFYLNANGTRATI